MDGTTIVEKKETTEVIGLDGKTSGNGTALSNIFDKIEQGKQEGKTTRDVIKENLPQPDRQRDDGGKFVKHEVKKEEKPAEKSELEKKLDETQADKTAKADKDEDIRETLKKATEIKAEEVKTDKQDDKQDEVPADELRVLDTDKPKTAKRIQALLKKVSTTESEFAKTKAERDEKAAKLAELEKKLSEVKTVDPKTDEAIKKQLDELSMYRRRYELDTDPEVKTKFEGRVEAAEQSIVDVLKKRGAGEALLKTIKEEGGWSGFASSNRQITLPDGDGGTKQVPAAEVADAILQGFPLGERKAVEAAMMEQAQTKRERERFFKEEQSKANDYFKQREEEAKKGSVAQQQQVEEAKKVIDNYQKALLESEWLKDKEIPANATPAQKAEAEEFNKYNGQLKSLVSSALNVRDLNGMLGLVQDSVLYYNERRTTAMLKRENEQLKKELASKGDELTKFKKASGSVPRGGSIAVAPTSDDRTPKKARTLEEAFQALERGENLKDE